MEKTVSSSLKDLKPRLISAAIMAPLFFFVVWYGHWPFLVVLILAGLLACYEWIRLAKHVKFMVPIIIIGVCYVFVSFGSFYMLRSEYFMNVALLFVFMVWFSDIGAYILGRLIGGPKLIQVISPNKTWSGLAGAMLSPALLAAIYVVFQDDSNFAYIVYAFVIGAMIGFVGQVGDLLISFFKRKAQVKDTGALIPGHGGLLDRIDAMMLAAPFFFLVMMSYSNVF